MKTKLGSKRNYKMVEIIVDRLRRVISEHAGGSFLNPPRLPAACGAGSRGGFRLDPPSASWLTPLGDPNLFRENFR